MDIFLFDIAHHNINRGARFRTHERARAHTHTHTHSHILTHTHTDAHAHTHTYARSYARAHAAQTPSATTTTTVTTTTTTTTDNNNTTEIPRGQHANSRLRSHRPMRNIGSTWENKTRRSPHCHEDLRTILIWSLLC